MFNVRSAVLGAALASSLPLGGCAKNKANTAATEEPQAAVEGGGDGAPPSTVPTTPAEPKVRVRASFEGLEDMMGATKMVLDNVNPENAFDPKAQLGALLLASGFGPAFLANIELDGVHSVGVAYPPKGGESIRDLELSAAFAVRSARALLEAMPPSFHPQPLGEGSWELRLDDATVLLKEAGSELQLGLSPQDLALAGQLDRTPSPGRRVRARVENLPLQQFRDQDLPLLKQIPGLEAVLEGTKALLLEVDYGTERAAQFATTLEAPFHKLGLDPIGTPRTAATAVEARLPADPFFAMTMSWGDPALVHASIDRLVPLDQIPEPFGQIATQAVAGVHGVLDQLANDVVFAVYVAPNGESTLLVAADVKEDENAAAGLRMISTSVVQALENYAIAQGKNDAVNFKVDYKGGSLRLGAVKADRMTVSIPSDFRRDFEDFETFIKKDVVEVVSWVAGNTAVLAIGAGAKAVSGDIAKSLGKPRKTSLAQDTGLADIRATMGGCQVCASFDIVAYLRFRLQLLAAQRKKDKEIQKTSKSMLASLAKAEVKGEPSLGVRVEAETGTIAFNVPQSLVFTEHEALALLKGVNTYVDGAAAASPSAPASGE